MFIVFNYFTYILSKKKVFYIYVSFIIKILLMYLGRIVS